MKTISNDVVTEIIINKSRFITYLKKISTVDEAKKCIAEIKQNNPDANHHVVAYIIGNSGENGHYTDDGEPSGTAGYPVLDVFKKNNITNFICIVVRYFGGIKLGAGGLIRAYSQSASTALKETTIVDIINYEKVSIKFNYNYLNVIENKLKNYQILSKNFQTNITFEILIPTTDIELVISTLISITNNQAEIKKI